MLKNFRKIFTKIKTKDILENNLSHCEDEIHKNIDGRQDRTRPNYSLPRKHLNNLRKDL